jgi:oleandomycin transport system ATP-binding protein
MTQPAIVTEQLSKSFGRHTVLSGLNLRVPAGIVCGLLGRNGAGKTTAVRILATLLAPDSGRARVAGFDVVAQAQRARAQIGLTGQYAAVDDLLTARENLYLIGRLLGLRRRPARARAAALLEQFGLGDVAGAKVATFSGGMRRRLDLAASLTGTPPVLFLDEPTTGLDLASRRQLWELIRGLAAAGTTVLLTTQYLEEAERLADQVVVLHDGAAVAEGTPAQLRARAGGPVLEVRPLRAGDVAATAGALRRLAGAAPEVTDGLLTVRVAGEEMVTAVARELGEAGLPVARLDIRLPSLDEAFLALTGGAGAAAGELPAQGRVSPGNGPARDGAAVRDGAA